MNIFETIYAKLLIAIITVKDDMSLNFLLDSLYECLKVTQSWKQPSDWNKVDDVFEKVFDRLPLESDMCCCTILTVFIARVTLMEIEENETVKNIFKFIPVNIESTELSMLRDVCKIHENLLSYRWNKKVLESIKQLNLLVWTSNTRYLLNAIHVCYVACIYGIPLEMLNHQLIDFIEAFISVLLAMYKTSSKNADLKKVRLIEIYHKISFQINYFFRFFHFSDD